MKMKKVMAVALSMACAATMLSATAVTASAADKKEVVIWDYFETDAQKEMIQSLMDGFNASQDEYEATHVYVPFSDYEKQLTLGIASGELPDLVILDGCSMASFIQLGLFGDISDADINWDEYIEGPLESTMMDGKHYGIPFATNCTALYYNKDMFDAAGIDYPDGSWTWDEFYDIAEKLTKEDGSQYGFAANPSNEQDTWMNIVYSMGGTILTDDNKSGFDDPNTIKAMEFVDKCVKNVMPPASTMSETGTDVLFGSGKVAMISQGSWMVSAFKDNDYIKEHCDVARLPKDAETGESVSLYNGLGWAASANTDMPDEAFQLIEWFGTKDMQQKQADLGVTMAAYEGMSDGWVNSVDCFNLQPYMDAMDNIVFRPHTNATLAWWNPMCEELKKPWNDEESMDDACKNIVTIMNDAIAEESY